jgi:hypothetical protein
MSQYLQARRLEIMQQSFRDHFCAAHKISDDVIAPADVLCAIGCSPGCHSAQLAVCWEHYKGMAADIGGICLTCGGTPHVSEPVEISRV